MGRLPLLLLRRDSGIASTSSSSSAGVLQISTSHLQNCVVRGRRGEGKQHYPIGKYSERIIVASSDKEEEDKIKLECDESGCVLVKTTSKMLEEEDDRTGFLCCDLAGGCYLPPKAVMDMLKKIDAINLEQEKLASTQKVAAANA